MDDMYTYVIYYLNPSDPVWKISVTDDIMSTTMSEYSKTIVEGMEVTGNLNYLKIEAEEAAAPEETTEGGDTEASEETPAEDAAEEQADSQ